MNSYEVERCLSVWTALANDTELSNYVCDRDLAILHRRSRAEGLTLLTVSLPMIGKALDDSFRTGYFSPVPGFKREKGHSYPLLLAKAFNHLFDPPFPGDDRRSMLKPEVFDHYLWCRDVVGSDDKGLDDTITGAVRAIRQLTLMFYKTETPYSEEQLDQVKQAFIQAESDLVQIETLMPDICSGGCDFEIKFISEFGIDRVKSVERIGNRSGVLTRARVLLCRLLSDFDPMDIQPKHGSGASACKQTPWGRYAPKVFVPRLDRVYPYSEWFFAGGNHLVDEYQSLEDLTVEDEPMARVAYVPKDSRGPRLISTEPAELMFIQQGLMAKLYDAIETYPHVREQVSCIDQQRNKDLARDGSIGGHYATLDLKEASDRVSLWLVERLFPSQWVRSLLACRSSGTVFPDGTRVLFRKFAPMGSACCFPVEALCFWALTLAAIEPNVDKALKALYVRSKQSAISDDYRVCVFGDDIIVPTQHADKVTEVLEFVGLKVNKTKSYLSGPFRESCGGDYFHGMDVTYTKCRHLPVDADTRNDTLMVRYLTVEWFNNLIGRYSEVLSPSLITLYQKWYDMIPVSSNWTKTGNSAAPSGNGAKLIGFEDSSGGCPTRYSTRLHRREVYTIVGKPRFALANTSNWSYVLRALLVGASDRPDRFALAKRVQYKYGWVNY